MKLLAISEHYFPRVGGTVNYVHETLCALSVQGVEVELVVPGPAPDSPPLGGLSDLPYTVTWIDADYPSKGDPSREARYAFCQKVDALAAARANGPDKPDVLHVLFGLFVMEVLDTAALRQASLPSLATVHNVPPMECRQIAHDAPLKARAKEALRLQAVAWKNRTRLRRHGYDLYITPSEQVRGFLTPIVGTHVKTIGHGMTSDLQAQMSPPDTRRPSSTPLRLLTAGGYAPHKRQHIIPETAALLQEAGLDFVWDVVGPAGRVKGYHDTVARDVAARGLEKQVFLNQAVPFANLGALYDRAHIYVQPSIEEGFCLTALDAAAAGLPVIASRAGALADIVAASGGTLVARAPTALATAIADFATADRWPDALNTSKQVQQTFSWEKAASTLVLEYDRISQ